jgi:DNA-binding response OmpR family regulator
LVVANDESAKNLILQYGADDFIIKPVNVGTIFSKASILLFRER